jgi:DNA-binding GntR family transcriptional regulator
MTLTSEAYHRLLDDILWGRLEAGRRLRLQELKDKYQIGSSPLREALSRLAESGLVQREENRGFRVCPMTLADFDELITTRCWLEEIALRDSILHGDKAWEDGIVLALHWLTRAHRSDNAAHQTKPEWEDLHRKFHLALLSACRSKTLIDFCDQLLYRTLRYRNLSGNTEYREQQERDEHRSICEAVLERDADTAVARLQAHYRLAQDIVAASGAIENTPPETE